MDLLALFKLYSKNRSISNLKLMIQEKVKLSGQLFFDFSQLVTDFFNLKISQGVTYKKPSSPQTSPGKTQPRPNCNRMILNDLNKLQDCVDKRDFKRSPLLLKELRHNATNLVNQIELIQKESAKIKEETSSLVAEELAKAKEEARERMKVAQQENKVLRSRNSGLNKEALDIKLMYETSQNKLNYVSKALDCLLVGEDVNVDLDQNNNDNVDEDLIKIVKALNVFRSNLKSSKRKTQGQNRINLIISSGKKYYVHSNKNNNIFVPEMEKIIGKKVVSLKIPHVVGTGFKEYLPEKNYIDCPDLGWPEVEFQVVTKEHENHLGQGCANTNGSGQRRLGDGGPMFPPHVVGPRICTA